MTAEYANVGFEGPQLQQRLLDMQLAMDEPRERDHAHDDAADDHGVAPAQRACTGETVQQAAERERGQDDGRHVEVRALELPHVRK